MLDEGYAAATRRIASEAGVKQALVYYYFPSMDDLFVEVLPPGAEVSLARMREALNADDPLLTLWTMNSDDRLTVLNTEFMALANHRKAIRAELEDLRRTCPRHRDRCRRRQLRARGIDTKPIHPSRSRCSSPKPAQPVQRNAVGVTLGHNRTARVRRTTTPAAQPTPVRSRQPRHLTQALPQPDWASRY